jgi:uroporphyrinogen-III synthase
MDAEWPATTIVGAVGAVTREAVLTELRGVERATIVAPNVEDESGSEAFWRAWQSTRRRVRRALLLRAESGRDWIIEQLRAEGAIVDVLAVYRRVPRMLTISDRDRLRQWLESAATPLTVVTSSEAVGTLLEQVRAVDGADGWLRGGTAVATHPRVAQQLHSAGFRHVETCDADDDAILRKLESIADRAAGSS